MVFFAIVVGEKILLKKAEAGTHSTLKNNLLNSFETLYCPFDGCDGKLVKNKTNEHYTCSNISCSQVWRKTTVDKYPEMFKDEQKDS